MPKKTALFSCRMVPEIREALVQASARERRSLSNFVEGAVIQSLPADLRKQVLDSLAGKVSALSSSQRHPSSPTASKERNS